ncbi:AvrD family protein [Streptomyces sp. NPDC050738]|uniref:AvrD family protein n=1 Tax=Streptomyces sp. NPDC050738 TaxID=3154744 RepID=UPI0034349CDE
MSAAAAEQQLLLRTVDDYLGPGETRFFSRGYQRADYTVYGITAHPAGAEGPAVTAKADIGYPADWSKKTADEDLRPHLSTVDALVLGVQLAELHLAHAYGLDAADRSAMRLRKVVLRAGGAPQEELEGIALSATLKATVAEESARGGHRSVYDSTVGGLRVRCEIDHPLRTKATAPARYDALTDALGPGEPRFYGEGFKLRRHTVEDVRVDMGALTAEATARFTAVSDTAPTEGIEGAGPPVVSLVDCFVVNLQLAQVLMYELDSLTRESSNTLWMMQTVLEAPEDPQPLAVPVSGALETATTLTAARKLPLRGGIWRTVELHSRMAGIEMRCSFAHELPA